MTNAVEFDKDQAPTESVVVAPEVAGFPAAAAAGTLKTEVSSQIGRELLEHLFAMAQRYRKEGNHREATELFWTLVEDHPGTPQADAAKAELLALAEGHERAGKQHMARSMYERLLDLEN